MWEGGIRAISWTDVFYCVLVFGTMLSGGIFLAGKAGGISNMFIRIAELDSAHLLLPGPLGVDGEPLWIAMFFVVPLGAFMGPQMWIRVYAVKEEKTFNIMPFLISITTVAYVGSMLSGNAGIILRPDYAGQPEYLLAALLIEHGPIWFMTIVLCGGAAAAISTANSQVHALSALVSLNIYKKHINPKAAERKVVRIGKIAVVVFCMMAYITMSNATNLLVFSGLLALSGTAQLFVPVCGALFWTKSNRTAALCSISCGIISLVILFFFFEATIPIYPGFLALGINVVVFVTLSVILPADLTTRRRIQEIIAFSE